MSDPFLSQSWYRVANFRPRLSAHAQIHRHHYRGKPWYVLQDHASGRVHRFTPSAYAFIARMDGRRTADDIWTEIAAQLEDDAPTQDDVIGLLTQLHTADVLQGDMPPDGAELLDRRAKRERATWTRALKSPLSVKLALWDPDRFLAATLPMIGPFFGWFGAILWLAVVIPAAVLAGQHWTELTENLADQVFATENLILMSLIFPVVKALHEFGHGYMTKRFGGEVHEFGVMFLVFMPSPYCDASASSALRSKWRRAAVGAAGMLVELFVAALAMYCWLLAEPGMLRAVAFNVTLIAGVSTIVFNINPLLRFDGYYILSDLVEIPNLGNRANAYWGHVVERYVFGTPGSKPFPATTGERVWFLFYAPAAFFYRTLVLFGIVLIVGAEYFVIGVLLAAWAVATGLVFPIGKILWHVVSSPRLRRNRGRAVAITSGAIAVAAALLLLLRMPLHTTTEGVVWLPEDAYVRAGAEGFARRVLAQPGAPVNAGAALIESYQPALEVQIRVLEARLQELEAKLDSERFAEPVQAEITRNEIGEARATLDREQDRARRLVARSAVAGRFVPVQAEDLPDRFHKEGDVLGYVLPAEARVARVVVGQDDIELVRHRIEAVELKLPDRAAETIRTAVVREVPAALDRLPSKALSTTAGGPFASDPRDPDGVKTLQRLFQFDVDLPASVAAASFGSRVFVRFTHDWEPWGFQIYRRMRQLFLSRFNA